MDYQHLLTRGARPAGYSSRSVSQSVSESVILSVTTILAPCVDSVLQHRRGWSLRGSPGVSLYYPRSTSIGAWQFTCSRLPETYHTTKCRCTGWLSPETTSESINCQSFPGGSPGVSLYYPRSTSIGAWQFTCSRLPEAYHTTKCNWSEWLSDHFEPGFELSLINTRLVIVGLTFRSWREKVYKLNRPGAYTCKKDRKLSLRGEEGVGTEMNIAISQREVDKMTAFVPGRGRREKDQRCKVTIGGDMIAPSILKAPRLSDRTC